MLKILLKRGVDNLIALLLLIILLPLLMLVSGLILLKLGRPIFFTQERLGKNNRPFKLYKFRSMLNSTDATGQLLSDRQRLTAFGRLLRKSSIDELPQLLNILKGEMSLVGPRPLFTHYLPYYSTEELKRHDVLPGITGWAQINGRNNTLWDKRLALDVWYVNNQSLFLDLKIIFLTVIKVFSGKDTLDSQRDNVADFDQYRKAQGIQ